MDRASPKNPQQPPVSRCPTKVLDDVAAEEDLLGPKGEVGPHARIAGALAEAIKSGDLGGKMVGLEGGWGSGKTTIINLLRKDLHGQANGIGFFCFDAWAHEGDPLRRTYLESLIDYFQSAGWVNRSKWDKTLDDLAHRRKVTHSKTIPNTTGLGKWIAISAFAVPLGLAIFNKSLERATIGWGYPVEWGFVFGLLLTLLPVLIFLMTYLVRKAQRKDAPDVALFKGEITENTQEATETPQPTSIEFETRFNSLMSEALGASERRVVIVLDNLDRVNVKDALTIWATLQTFHQHRGQDKNPWFKKICIIVPYDPHGLQQLWDGGDQESRAASADSDSSVVADSFIDKSFQVRFEVPPLLLSNWKAYLSKLLEEALPEHSEDDRHDIYRTFMFSRPSDAAPPTPRELRLYVNEIGAVHRQWQDRFPIQHVAYYASLRRNHENIEAGLRLGRIPSDRLQGWFSSDVDLRGSLAGLFYNALPALGMQLLLANPITQSLTEGGAEELLRLENVHQDGFWAVFEEVIASRLNDFSPIGVAKTAMCLERSRLFADNHRIEAVAVRRRMASVAQTVSSSPIGDSATFEGMTAMCRLLSDEQASRSIANAFRNELKKPQLLGIDEANKLITNLVAFSRQLMLLGHNEAVDAGYVIPVTAQTWIAISPEVMAHDERWRQLFKPASTFNEILDALSELVRAGNFSAASLDALRLAQANGDQVVWEPVCQAIEQRLQTGQATPPSEVDVLIHGLTMLRLEASGEAEAVLAKLSRGGQLMHWLYAAQTATDVPCTAWCVGYYLLYNDSIASLPPAVGNSAAGYKLFQSLLNSDDADLAAQMVWVYHIAGRVGDWFRIVDSKGYHPLIVRCLRMLADDPTTKAYSPEILTEHWKDLITQLPEESAPTRFLEVVKHLCSESDLANRIQADESGFKYEDSQLYSVIFAACASNSFKAWCQKGIEDLPSDVWKSELETFGHALRLALALSLTLKINFHDALIALAQDIVAGRQIPIPELLSRWGELFALLDRASRSVLPVHLLELVPRNGEPPSDVFFEMFGEQLQDPAKLRSENGTIAKILSPLVRDRRQKGLSWLRNVLTANPDLLDQGFDGDLVREFRDRLQAEVNRDDSDDDASGSIREIAEILQIRREYAPDAP